MTDFETVTRESVTPEQLFDLAHDIVTRLGDLEWAFSCLLVLNLDQLGIIDPPAEPEAIKATLRNLEQWLTTYRAGRDRIERDRQQIEREITFLEAPE